jgi:hypothetical protein
VHRRAATAADAVDDQRDEAQDEEHRNDNEDRNERTQLPGERLDAPTVGRRPSIIDVADAKAVENIAAHRVNHHCAPLAIVEIITRNNLKFRWHLLEVQKVAAAGFGNAPERIEHLINHLRNIDVLQQTAKY